MIEQQIQAKLDEIEQKYDVTILMAIESGSRSWGFSSPDSDYDVRFIYAHNKDWYLQVFDRKDIIELAINDELDINGWDLKKALALAAKGNTVVFEWLNTPIIYRAHPCFEKSLRDGVNGGFNPASAFHHYFSLAKRFMSYLGEPGDDVKLKKLFYLLRAQLSALWILQKHTMPPVQFNLLMDELVKQTEPELYTYINHLITDKSTMNEAEGKPIRDDLLSHINKQMTFLDEQRRAEQTWPSEGKYVQADWNRLFQQVLNGL